MSSRHRPIGITVIAAGLGLLAGWLTVLGVLIELGVIPFTAGAVLLGGLETMGPVIYFIFACVAGLTAVGLLRMDRWARRLASIISAALLVGGLPAISSAVTDVRVVAIVREGLRIILAVAAFRYLNTEAVREAFAGKADPSLRSG